MVEERREASAEAASDDGGGVEEAFAEDWDSGQLVVGFVRVVDDDDLGLGRDGLGWEGLAEADRIGPRALLADGPPSRWWFGGCEEVVGGISRVHVGCHLWSR